MLELKFSGLQYTILTQIYFCISEFLKQIFEYKIAFWIWVLTLWIQKGYFVLKLSGITKHNEHFYDNWEWSAELFIYYWELSQIIWTMDIKTGRLMWEVKILYNFFFIFWTPNEPPIMNP